MKRLFLVQFLSLFILGHVHGQPSQVKFGNLSVSRGLSQSEVNSICQDREGFIWIGTRDGVNRYDGYEIKVYRSNTDVPHSISNNTIQTLFVDREGILWIGTMGGGLNRYDVEKDGFTVYRHSETNNKSIGSDNINLITQTKNGIVLIGTQMGLTVLNRPINPGDQPSFNNYFDFEINAILEDPFENIWLASWNGLYKVKFNSSGEPIILAHFAQGNSSRGSLASNGVLTLFLDTQNNLWIGTTNGINLLQPGMIREANPVFLSPDFGLGSLAYLKKKIILSIHEDLDGNIMFGTRGEGLCIYEPNSGMIDLYKATPYNPNTLKNNSVKCFFSDRTGVLWIGTFGGGVCILDMNRKKFSGYEIATDQGVPATSNFIRIIYQDSEGMLWIGTLDGGLFRFDRKRNVFTPFKTIENYIELTRPANMQNSIYGKSIFSITEDADRNLWIGSNGGINILNRKTGQLSYHTMDFQNPDSLMSNAVFSITRDDDNTLWIGTWSALHHYIPGSSLTNGKFVRYLNDPGNPYSISNNIVRYVYNDPFSADLWICTLQGGLNRLVKNPKNDSIRFIRYQHDDKDPNSLSSNEVNMVLRTSAGDLWIATSDGLNRVIPETAGTPASFKRIGEKDGLAGYHVQSILEDHNGNLWLGTNKGLSKYNPATGQFNNFDVSDGLPGKEFSEHTCFKTSNGEMFFGSVNGFISFFPDSIHLSKYQPVARLTNLLISNETVPIGKLPHGRTILSRSVTNTDEISLSYKDNIFTIEFSALYYVSLDKIKYAYKLEGFNESWLYTDASNRRATYTNLAGGSYTFLVKASNNDGIWQTEPTRLVIHIEPPIWKTWQALVVYMLVLALLAYVIFREFKSKEQLKSEIALKNLEREKADELNQLKIQFFTNITHEFRTPLTLLILPLENLLESVKGNAFLKEQLELMHRNARYLLRLINELLDFRKTETSSWKLFVTKNDLVHFGREIFSAFSDVAERRDITYTFTADVDELEVWFDRQMLVKILNNLIYNAFKFTSDGGKIEVIIQGRKESDWNYYTNKYEITQEKKISQDFATIKIRDNGIGISANSIYNIFNRYYQVGSSDSFKHMGSGIGLALSKNLVLLSKGEIGISSERGKGTEFIIRLPLGDSCFDESEKTAEPDAESAQANDLLNTSDSFVPAQIITPQSIDTSHVRKDTSAPTVLLVEDNDEMRHFIKGFLERNYRIIEAANGKEGYELAIEKIPDLIISDIIMPEMGGIELCHQLKRNILTSHIPIVLLTALSSVADQIKGLDSGADDYISKPFNMRLFEIRIENLIRLRKHMRERFSKEFDTSPKDFTLNTRDQEFLDKAIQIVKEKITDQELNVDILSRETGMSRMHLHRKLTSLTDQAPGEFIRMIRLKESAKLLAENNLTISEIAYAVGFSSPSYFTTSFGKQFGISPSKYIEKFAKHQRGSE